MTIEAKSVIVIGAGVGGTALAARLGKLGYNVTVVEKNGFTGGRCSIFERDGHRFDQGPSLYLMPSVFEETFADLGEDITDWVELRKLPNNYKVHFHDGDTIELSSDLTKMKSVIEKYETNSNEPFLKFLDFLKESHAHYETSVQQVLKSDFQHWWQLFRLKWIPELFRLHLFYSLYGRMATYFKSDHLRRAFTFQTMYMGMSPFDAPATYNLLQYTEFAHGIWYPVGGFWKVVESIEKIAKDKFGVRFIYNSPVERIVIENGSAKGVELANGTIMTADAVVSNADLVYTYNNLLPSSSYGKRLQGKKLTCSSISLYWAMSEVIPELDTHNIFLAEAYKESFDQIFKEFALPSEPSFYVNVPSRVDPSAAPKNADTIVVLIPTGPLSDKISPQEWPSVIARAKKQVLATIIQRTGRTDFESLIKSESITSPLDWESKFNLFQGSILGLSHTIFQVLWFRPAVRHASYKNFFFVGASAHPGTGVPVVLCGSGVTSRAVDRYLRGQSDFDRVALEGYIMITAILCGILTAGLYLMGAFTHGDPYHGNPIHTMNTTSFFTQLLQASGGISKGWGTSYETLKGALHPYLGEL